MPPERFFTSSPARSASAAQSRHHATDSASFCAGQPVVPAKRRQILLARQPRIKSQFLRNPSQHRARRGRSWPDCQTPPRCPASGITRPTMLRISVLLPAPFGPSNPRHSPLVQFKRNAVQRRHLPEPLDQRRRFRAAAPRRVRPSCMRFWSCSATILSSDLDAILDANSWFKIG